MLLPNQKSLHSPTPYAQVNAVLNRLLVDARFVLGDYFVGMYLYGSLASGDFDLQYSDVDFVVVITGDLPQEMVQDLKAMHARLVASGLPGVEKLEGAYVPRDVLRRHDPRHPPCPCVNEGRFYRARLGSDWVIQRHVLREQGRVVAGPAPQMLIDPVAPDALRDAVLGFLCEWWAPMLKRPDPRLDGTVYQAYAVLTMCRALYTLRTGTIVSKSRAARWAQRTLDQRWSALIEWAQRRGAALPQPIDEILAFIQHTLQQGQVNTDVSTPVPEVEISE
jgi:hypothetical protein